MHITDRYKDVVIEGEAFRITQMGAEDACFLLSLLLQKQDDKSLQTRREESDYRVRLHLKHCFRLKDVGGQQLPVALDAMDAAATKKDPLFYEHRKLPALIEASHEYNVVDPTIAGEPEEVREPLRAALMGRSLPARKDDSAPAQ